ncbi:hypothetical protein POVWA2_035600 [Plasmodium ovale wallikeri]|uniref:Uncharacterized protein n=1 Tax=Plasmodium ovale wallikeri TaxID=864142 RepID=A0A1A8Z3B3_PLAOA|nr:hypothetical protein POVWA2_035600 [Plasmodium ovale wallikeri]
MPTRCYAIPAPEGTCEVGLRNIRTAENAEDYACTTRNILSFKHQSSFLRISICDYEFYQRHALFLFFC